MDSLYPPKIIFCLPAVLEIQSDILKYIFMPFGAPCNGASGLAAVTVPMLCYCSVVSISLIADRLSTVTIIAVNLTSVNLFAVIC